MTIPECSGTSDNVKPSSCEIMTPTLMSAPHHLTGASFAALPGCPGHHHRGNVPAGEHHTQLTRLGQLTQRFINRGLQVPVRLADRRADREAIFRSPVEEPQLSSPLSLDQPVPPRRDHITRL